MTMSPGTGVDLSHRVFTDFAVGVSTVFQGFHMAIGDGEGRKAE